MKLCNKGKHQLCHIYGISFLTYFYFFCNSFFQKKNKQRLLRNERHEFTKYINNYTIFNFYIRFVKTFCSGKEVVCTLVK